VPVSGGIVSKEGFIEGRMPLGGGHARRRGTLNLEAGYRYSSYDLGSRPTLTRSVSDWAPVQDVRLRGSFARAVRAPNVVELFAPSAVGLGRHLCRRSLLGCYAQFSLTQWRERQASRPPSTGISLRTRRDSTMDYWRHPA